MFTSIRLTVSLVLVVSVCSVALAQTVSDSRSSTSVTAAGTEQGMRFTATADVVEMRLEIFSAAGEKVSESDFRRGNLLDWSTQDGPGVSTEPHLWVVTVKTLTGLLRQRHGVVSWQSGRAQVQRVERDQMPAAQTQAWDFSRAAQTLPPVAMDADADSFSVLADQVTPAVTITGHDSETGQVTSTAGALTFRTGDLFAGKDVERMRITEDGKVGIGTDNPQATLDVGGAVRASEGFRFLDGTTLTAKNGKLSVTDGSGATIDPKAAGTGTQNQVAKWTETGGAGTLGDSAITELNGNVGIGLTNPDARLHVFGSTETVRQTISNTNSYIQFGFYEGAVKKGAFGYQGSTSTGFVGGPGAMVFGTLTGSPVAFFTNGTEKVRLDTNGNLGIGTPAPTAKLHVAGTVNFTGLRTELVTTIPSIIGGNSNNSVRVGASGATIGGGGGNNPGDANRVTDDFGTVGGGQSNRVGDDSSFPVSQGTHATVGGGHANVASGTRSTISGGYINAASGLESTVSGGTLNTAGPGSNATVGGGRNNNATSFNSTVSGGNDNDATASYSAVGGGLNNDATGEYSVVPGGRTNVAQGHYSFAAGRRAKSFNQGSFVWADSTNADFSSTANDQFLIRATGGVGIGTNDPANLLHVSGPGTTSGGCCGETPTATEVVGHFIQPADTAHSAISVDASGATGGQPLGRDSILYFAKGGTAIWGFRNDADTGDKFQLRYHGDGGFADTASRLTILPAGNVGLGTNSPTQRLQVSGGVRLATTDARPVCSAETRGTFWFAQGASGVKDEVSVCAKDAADTYAWRVLY